jgi:predicted small lipoprotein YifL
VTEELKMMRTQSRVTAEKNRQGAKAQRRTEAHSRANIPLRLCASAVQMIQPLLHVSGFKPYSATAMVNRGIILKLILALSLALPVAACGTKTELLMPNGKRTPQNERDPSQPPSPISR